MVLPNAEAEYVEVKQGDTLPFAGMTFQVLNPYTTTGDDLNNNSVVLRLVYGQVSFLFTGDAQQDAEARMIADGFPLKADILKVGHHGSHTSSSEAFLAQVKPVVAIYSAGAGNTYGHPHAETIAALNAVGAKIYGTDQNGTISVTTEGNTYEINVAKETAQAPPAVVPPAAQNAPLSLEIASVTSPIAPGGRATLTAKTLPGADCTITVYYKSGPSKAKGLNPQTADVNGDVSWSWTVGSNTTPGNWRIVVTASANGETVTQETTFTVQK